MTIKYPASFERKLARNPRIRAAIDTSIGVVNDLLQVSTLPFFPDYTGHGVDHLSSVLEIVDKLIAKKSRTEFTPEDAAVLTFSVLLHDLALHLSEAGFETLLSMKSQSCAANGQSWGAKFVDFISEAKHWDEHHLAEVFGVDEFGAPRSLARDPREHFGALTESDRKLIGEFIRRHHAVLAYEFSLGGIPGAGGQRIEFGDFPKDLRDLAGHVARSHGIPLRTAIRHLDEAQVSCLESGGVHPVYLMGLLRIADFLELGPNRAPLIAFQYKEISSSVSQREWRTNQAFRQISWGNPDPESIQIPARPDDVQSFLNLRRWLTGIQGELDATWAVYGEIYGSHHRFSKFQLSIRRIHSNILDDPEAFARNCSFLPKRVNLGVGGPEVLNLFIEPLYGSRPEIGIRELIQNSVDAVRERRALEGEASQENRSPDTSPDVLVWLDPSDGQGNAELTVTDRGIGMTEEVITEYFLKAGASFRRNIAWKRQFESESRGSHLPNIRASVLRSGRFGIGVLAAFLLGDRIEVSTRHVTSHRGIRFSVSLDLDRPLSETDSLQLDYDGSIPIGTTISVRVTKVQSERPGLTGTNIFTGENLWDWYCLSEPSVQRVFGTNKRELKQTVTVPPERGPLPRGWHSVPSSDFRTVHVYTGGYFSSWVPSLICNGIKVTPGEFGYSGLPMDYANSARWISELFPGQGTFRLKPPSFSIFDPDGNLPLNLQRTGLTNINLDFLPHAFAVQAKTALANILTFAPSSSGLPKNLLECMQNHFEIDQVIPIFFTQDGLVLLTARNLQMAEVKKCLLVEQDIFERGWLLDAYKCYDAVLICRAGSRGVSARYALNNLCSWVERARIFTTSDDEPTVGHPLRFRYREGNYGTVYVRRGRDCPPSLLSAAALESVNERIGSQIANSKRTETFIAAELFLKDFDGQPSAPDFSIGEYWHQVIRESAIPFDPTIRQTKLRRAYEELSEFAPIDISPKIG